MRRFVIVSLVTVVGCSTSSSGSAPPIAPEDLHIKPLPAPKASEAAPASAGMAASSEPQKPRHPAGEEIHDPPPRSQLGAPCSNDRDRCGRSGKVALVREVARMRTHDPPCAAVVVQDGMEMKRACVDGDRIYVTSTCMPCRIFEERWMHGILADMTPEQLADAQKHAGMPARPPLTTIDDWTRAITAAASKFPQR